MLGRLLRFVGFDPCATLVVELLVPVLSFAPVVIFSLRPESCIAWTAEIIMSTASTATIIRFFFMGASFKVLFVCGSFFFYINVMLL